jgi:hypothetical protein
MALPDQPPLPDHLENHLIWVDSIKVIPLGLLQNVPWAHSRNPYCPGYSHDTVLVMMEFNWYCIGLLWSKKLLAGSLGSKRPQVSPLERRKPIAGHLMRKQGCNCQFCNHKIFNHYKTRSVSTFALHSCSRTIASSSTLYYFCPDPGMCSRYFDPHYDDHVASQKISQLKTCPCFRLSVGNKSLLQS